jgi:xylulokinase
LTGGGVKSAKWRQIVADICDAPVTVFEQDEGASFGAALQALHALEGAGPGDWPGLASDHLSRNEAMCCEPRSAAVHFYNDTYRDYRAAVSAISTLYN